MQEPRPTLGLLFYVGTCDQSTRYNPGMFAYDASLLACLQTPPSAIADVLSTMRAMDAILADGDGLKWFNWLYLQVTAGVDAQVSGGGYANPAFLAELDVQFARLYFDSLRESLSGQPLPDCWGVLFSQRSDVSLGRIQFALAGINAHINHDLPMALVATCQGTKVAPAHGTSQYSDYTAVNSTLDSLVEAAKQTLHVRLLGEILPPVSALENTIAAWSVTAAREAAWNNAELLWHLQPEPLLSSAFLNSLDGLSAVIGKSLLIPIA